MDLVSDYIDFLSYPSLNGFLAIAGFIFAIYTWFKARKKHRFSSHSIGSTLIGSSFSELPQQVEILYEGEQVTQVTSSTFILWNSGNQVIMKERLKTIDPLRIDISEGGKILKYDIIKTNNKTNNFSIKKNDTGNSLNIEFDFLEPLNGIRINILHTGKQSNILCNGTIIGNKRIGFKNKKPALNSSLKKTVLKSSSFISKSIPATAIALLLMILAVSFIFPESITMPPTREVSNTSIWFKRLILLLYIAPFAFIIYKSRLPYPSSLKDKMD